MLEWSSSSWLTVSGDLQMSTQYKVNKRSQDKLAATSNLYFFSIQNTGAKLHTSTWHLVTMKWPTRRGKSVVACPAGTVVPGQPWSNWAPVSHCDKTKPLFLLCYCRIFLVCMHRLKSQRPTEKQNSKALYRIMQWYWIESNRGALQHRTSGAETMETVKGIG